MFAAVELGIFDGARPVGVAIDRLLEACVAGVPVIASRVGGIPEVIEHEQSGLLFESGDDAALAAGLLRLLSKPQEASQLAATAKSRVYEIETEGRSAP